MHGQMVGGWIGVDRQADAKTTAVTYQPHTAHQECPGRSGCSTCQQCTAHTMTSSEHCSWTGSSQVDKAEGMMSQPHSSDRVDSGHLRMIHDIIDAGHVSIFHEFVTWAVHWPKSVWSQGKKQNKKG